MSHKDPVLLERIESTLDSLRPYLEADNGNVSLVEVTEDMIVKLELLGACSSCSMSHMTLKGGLEEALKQVAPEVKGVEAVQMA